MGVKVLNLHQGVLLNPYINYPFEPTAMARQANFSDTCKSLGVESTKIYFTVSGTTREILCVQESSVVCENRCGVDCRGLT